MAADPKTLAQRLLDGDKRALARGISLVEDDDPAGLGASSARFYPEDGQGRGRRFHGAAGRGQVHADRCPYQAPPRAQPRSRGALDRPLLAVHPGRAAGRPHPPLRALPRPGVFIRSMANRGALGGLSEAALQAALLMDASGKDDVFLETVGVGQAEVDIIDHADTIVLVLMPGSGDSIQALKAGSHGDPRHHRRQQGRPSADRHDGPRDPRRPVARPQRGLARSRSSRRGVASGRRGAGGRARRAPRVHRVRGARCSSAAGAT